MQDLTLLVVVRKRHGFRRQPRRERVLGFVWFGNARDNSFVSDRQHDYGILYDGHGKNHRDTGLDDAVGWLLVSAGGQSRHACRAPLHQSPPKTAAVHPGPRAAAKRNPTVVANNFDVVGGKLSVQRPRAALGCLCDIHFLGPVVPLSRDAWVCSLRPCSRCHCAGTVMMLAALFRDSQSVALFTSQQTHHSKGKQFGVALVSIVAVFIWTFVTIFPTLLLAERWGLLFRTNGAVDGDASSPATTPPPSPKKHAAAEPKPMPSPSCTRAQVQVVNTSLAPINKFPPKSYGTT
eukprot:m.420171 g.420171  ORF g.420171 m.420171 type:complete len:292 (+) comp20187_c0_seq8:907-1782(+)